MRQLFVVTLACGLCASPALAQQAAGDDPSTQPTAATAPAVEPDEGKIAIAERWIRVAFDREHRKGGFYPEFGGLPPGSGISAGPGYRLPLGGGRVVIDASAAIGSSRSTFAQAQVEVPQLAGNHLRIGAQARRQDFTRVNFYGIGDVSRDDAETDFRLQTADYQAFAETLPWTWFKAGATFGYTSPIRIERPRAANAPAIQDRFDNVGAPGLTDRPAFLHGEVYARVDTREHPGRPTTGGAYRVSFSTFSDRDTRRYSFRQVEGDALQYIPVGHRNSVLALRARVAGSDTSSGNTMPFYLLPTLGGSHSLRGFQDYRFRDRNALLLNAECRWPIAKSLDGAIFYDAGTVAARFRDLDLKGMESSYGGGVRLHAGNTTFVRLDVARSREGTRLLVSISDALRPGHGSILIPYIP
jgi:hypothetical protein